VKFRRIFLSCFIMTGIYAGSSKDTLASSVRIATDIPLINAKVGIGIPVLAPFAHVRFCLTHTRDCASGGESLLPDLDAAHWAMLVDVNRDVNAQIRARSDRPGALHDEWSINPTEGDCDDYAVSKRHSLLSRGWPSSALLLTHVRLPDGQDHLVLTVRTRQGDILLDNLASTPRPVARSRYDWIKIQSAQDPKLWHRALRPAG
jgi:predicted transglutaminase-like cysteine proteinase